MFAITNRSVTFIRKDRHEVVQEIIKQPVGTQVYVSKVCRNGSIVVRIPKTLFEMEIHINDVTPF